MADSKALNKEEDTVGNNSLNTTDEKEEGEQAPIQYTDNKEDIENYDEIATYQSAVYGNNQMIIKKNKQKQKQEQQEKVEKKQYGIDRNSIHFDDQYECMTTTIIQHYYPSLSTGIYGIYCINNTNKTQIVPKETDNYNNEDEEVPLTMKQRIKIMFDDNDEESDVILSDEEEEEEEEEQNIQSIIQSLSEQLKLEKNKNLQLQIAYEKHKINSYTELAAANKRKEDLQVLMKSKDEEILSMYLQLNEERNKIVDLKKNESLLQSEIDSLKQSLSQQKLTNIIQESKIKELNEESKEYKISVKRANDDNIQIQNSFNEMKKIVFNLRIEIIEWKGKTDELELKNSELLEEINLLKQKINDLEMNNVKLEEENKEMNTLKVRNNELESSTSKLFVSLENGLSFDINKPYRWYHDNDVVECVKIDKGINSNLVTMINGDIKSNVDIDKLILCPILKELDDVCQYVIQLRVNTEIALKNVINIKTEDNDDNDVKEDMVLTRQQSIYDCIICTEAIPNMFNYPCGHCCYCQKCAFNAIKMDPMCPNCRVQIIECKQMFKGGFRQ